MNDSFLAKLISLREEDFLTVSFGYLLQQDKQFKSDYLAMLGIKNASTCRVTLQPRYGLRYEDRPDIEIRGRDLIVFQENKVQSMESRDQLARYARRLKARVEKRKVLVYMSKRYPESRLLEASYGEEVTPLFLQWERVALLLQNSRGSDEKVKWLRQELYAFLKEKNMIPPSALRTETLNKYWPVFEPQRTTLSSLVVRAAQDLENNCGHKGYRCAVDISSIDSGVHLYVVPTKGKLAKYFSGYNGYIWIGGGVYFDADGKEAYVYFGLGWTRDYTDRIAKTAARYLASKGFMQDDEKYDGWYSYIPLKSLTGKAKTFEGQTKAFSKWIAEKSDITLKSFAIIQNGF